jgi:hypothetical protein
MANRNQYKAQDFVDAIPGTGGIVATIAKRVGCDWHTAKKYIDEYATVQQAYQDECEEVNDMVVSTILKAIKDGDTASAKWWASRKRKAEFGDALDVTTGGMPIYRVNWDEVDGSNS